MKQFDKKSSVGAGVMATLALFTVLLLFLAAPVHAAKNTGDAKTDPASGGAASGPAVTSTPVPTPTPTPPPPGKAKLRLIYTTDTHGQLTNMDYQRQTQVVRGLDRVSTLITQAREEMHNRNYMTFDVGDNIMDYTTDYIYSQDSSATQPAYQALALLGYDAITLGNHEFDYGLDYLTEQLNATKLMDKVVLSNVTSKYTGENAFGAENKIIEKEIVDENGNKRIVKIGLFGATPPTMSTRTEKVTNSLEASGFYDTAVKEVAALKEKGAEIIVALAHTGVGAENPSATAANAGYAMTRVDGLDVLLGGHQHIYFPDDNYAYLPGVDRNTWLVNGTRFLVLRDSARALGIVDLNLSFDSEGHLKIDNSTYDIRKVTASTEPDAAVTSLMNDWGKSISDASGIKIASIGENRWTTYLGSLESNPILQTVQNAQRAYAYQYIRNEAPEYADWPIICATRYGMFGNESGQEYGDVSGVVTSGRIQDFARYHQYIYVYEITGAQLKEWIEWSASCYQKPGTSVNGGWDDPKIEEYVRAGYGDSLITNENIRDWTSLFFFGGIEYTIDISQPARYSKMGNKISDSSRVTSLTYNGQPIADDQQFAIASDQLLAVLQVEATKGIYSHKIASDKVLLQKVVTDYLRSLDQLPSIDLGECNNWHLKFPNYYRFLLTTGDRADDVVKVSKWYRSKIGSANGYSYYDCCAPTYEESDQNNPCITLVPSSYETADSPVDIRVMANDQSGITEMKYCSGTRRADDENWYNIYAYQDVSNNTFTVEKSGIYTVFVRDGTGHAAVQSIAITNIDPDTLRTPTVDKVDNNDTVVTGDAQPGTTINVKIKEEVYQEKVDGDGVYFVDIPVQKAGTVIQCYVTDSKDRASTAVSTKVRRVGPNKPSGSAKNNSYYIKGKTNDGEMKMFAVYEDRVYVSKKLGAGYYKKCKKYDKSLTIKKTAVSVSKGGKYSIKIPHINGGEKIKVYNIDRFGRVSAARVITVKKSTYEPVACYDTYSSEKAVFGRIREGKKGYISVYYADGKKAGSGYSDKKGYFQIPVSRPLVNEEVLKLYARYDSDSESKSHPAKLEVDDLSDADSEDDLSVKKITTADDIVTGSTSYKNGIVSVIYDGTYKMKDVSAKGTFKVKLKKDAKKGLPVYVLVRTHNGYFECCRKKVIVSAPPSKPVIERVKKGAKTVIVSHKKELKMKLKVKKTLYTDPKVYYSNSKKRYIYTFSHVKNLKYGVQLTAIAQNDGGRTKSKPYTIS